MLPNKLKIYVIQHLKWKRIYFYIKIDNKLKYFKKIEIITRIKIFS